MMSRVMSRAFAIIVLVFAVPAFGIEAELGFDDPAMNERYRVLLREIRCPKCLNTSIADSDAPIAADLRREVHAKMAEGYSDDEIIEFLVARYGEFVVYRPPVKPSTWALWGGPVVLLLIGALVFAKIARERAAKPLDEDSIS